MYLVASFVLVSCQPPETMWPCVLSAPQQTSVSSAHTASFGPLPLPCYFGSVASCQQSPGAHSSCHCPFYPSGRSVAGAV